VYKLTRLGDLYLLPCVSHYSSPCRERKWFLIVRHTLMEKYSILTKRQYKTVGDMKIYLHFFKKKRLHLYFNIYTVKKSVVR
jgi:hypothetical protein